MWGSRDADSEFWEPPNISQTVEARNFKFGTDTDGSAGHLTQLWNLGTPNISRTVEARLKWVIWGSRDPVLEFVDALISHERLKLETSNIARRRMAVSSNEENAILGQNGSRGSHVTSFLNFGTSLLSRERLKLESSNWARIRMAVSSNE